MKKLLSFLATFTILPTCTSPLMAMAPNKQDNDRGVFNHENTLNVSTLDKNDFLNDEFTNGIKDFKWKVDNNKLDLEEEIAEMFTDYILTQTGGLIIPNIGNSQAIGADVDGTVTVVVVGNATISTSPKPETTKISIVLSGKSAVLTGTLLIQTEFTIPATPYDLANVINKMKSFVVDGWRFNDYKTGAYIYDLDQILLTNGWNPPWNGFNDLFSKAYNKSQELLDAGINLKIYEDEIEDDYAKIILEFVIDSTAKNYNKTYVISDYANTALEINFGTKKPSIGDNIVVNNQTNWNTRIKGGWNGNKYREQSGWYTYVAFSGYIGYNNNLKDITDKYRNISIGWSWSRLDDGEKKNSTMQIPTSFNQEIEIAKEDVGTINTSHFHLYGRITEKGELQFKFLVDGTVIAWQKLEMWFHIFDVEVSK